MRAALKTASGLLGDYTVLLEDKDEIIAAFVASQGSFLKAKDERIEELEAKLGDYVRTAWRTAFNANESLQVEKQDGSMLWIPTSAAYCVTSSIAEPDDWATGVWAADGCADERRCAIGDHPTLYDALLACRAAYLNF